MNDQKLFEMKSFLLWYDKFLKNQVTDLLKIHDDTITKLRSLQSDDDSCGCGHDHC